MTNKPNFGDVVEAQLHLANLLSEKDPNKKVSIYPLTRDSKLIKEVEPFEVPADFSSDQVEKFLISKGVKSSNWYGASEGEELPSKYYE